MSETAGVKYFDVSTRPEPVMPSACQTGGCGGPADDPRLQPAPPSFGPVTVNGAEIDPEAISRETQHHPAADGEAAWQAAARALVLRELLLQQAQQLGIRPQPQTDQAGRMETEEDAVVRALLEQEVRPAAVGETECRRYYDGNIQRFRTPDLFEASHILVEPDGDDADSWASAETQALAIIGEIGDDPALFAAAAQEFSGCPTAHQGGSLGQVQRGELVPVVQTALEALPQGSTGRTPIRSRYGWHVLRLQRTIEGHQLPFEIVRERIADMLETRAWATAAARYAAELAQSAEVEGVLMDPAAIANA